MNAPAEFSRAAQAHDYGMGYLDATTSRPMPINASTAYREGFRHGLADMDHDALYPIHDNSELDFCF